MRAVGLLACLAWVVAGCAGELENPERFGFLLEGGTPSMDASAPDSGSDSDASTPTDAGASVDAGGGAVPACVTEVLESSCATAACHGAGAAQIDLLSPGVVTRLVDQTAASAGLCAGRVYVAADGSESLLLDKLEDTPPCGSKMPLVGAITTTQKQCLTDWVGALTGAP